MIASHEKTYRLCYSEKCPEDRFLDLGDTTETCQTAEKCAARGRLTYEIEGERLCMSVAECVREKRLFIDSSSTKCIFKCPGATYELVTSVVGTGTPDDGADDFLSYKKCTEICGQYHSASEVTIGDKSYTYQLCHRNGCPAGRYFDSEASAQSETCVTGETCESRKKLVYEAGGQLLCVSAD